MGNLLEIWRGLMMFNSVRRRWRKVCVGRGGMRGDAIRYVCGSLTEDIGEIHFGGFLKKRKQSQTGEEAKPKTRKQVMDEIVSKSKAMKVRTISHHAPLCYTQHLLLIHDSFRMSTWQELHGGVQCGQLRHTFILV